MAFFFFFTIMPVLNGTINVFPVVTLIHWNLLPNVDCSGKTALSHLTGKFFTFFIKLLSFALRLLCQGLELPFGKVRGSTVSHRYLDATFK